MRRYQRRTTRVDEAILGVYLAGGNTRRIKGALAPLLRGGPLSKDAVSRLVGRLREDFETWRTRDLAEEDIRYVFMDGWYPKVRIGGRRERVPVLVTLGVRANGERVVLDMRLVGEESAASWTRGRGESRGAAPGAAGLGGDRRQSGPDHAPCDRTGRASRSSAARPISSGICRRRRRRGSAKSSRKITAA